MARVAVGSVDDFPPGSMKGLDVGKRKILLVNLDGEIHAVAGICSHAYSELASGFFAGDLVTCPLHLSQFDVRTGDPISPPATEPIATYPVTVEGDIVSVDLPD